MEKRLTGTGTYNWEEAYEETYGYEDDFVIVFGNDCNRKKTRRRGRR